MNFNQNRNNNQNKNEQNSQNKNQNSNQNKNQQNSQNKSQNNCRWLHSVVLPSRVFWCGFFLRSCLSGMNKYLKRTVLRFHSSIAIEMYLKSKSAFLALYAPSLNYWITDLISSLVISWGTSWSYLVAWFFP